MKNRVQKIKTIKSILAGLSDEEVKIFILFNGKCNNPNYSPDIVRPQDIVINLIDNENIK
ncbi:MAG: hypothetical protein PHT69_04415 [Bacteroidales bacterium]|nr:hypothetical protein [Bacteroidales bacterium]